MEDASRKRKFYTPAEALQKIAAFCAYQERNHKEVEAKLRTYGLDEDEAAEILMRLVREKLLDDERFARSFVRGKYRLKKWGRRRIRQELKQRGISEYCIKAGMSEIDGDEYYQNLVEVLEKKNAQEKEPNPHKRRQKLTLYATAKGYEGEFIQDALIEVLGVRK
ncbi:RecX family transcriptional regulator [Hymenobacter busanensis]|uniref:Regulatory protein RecX n=1 Tax=Hymenobacter busanensis TaxID=2607656 RepID=A0A7L5A103_9BACT|nr:regulatory protein RecX [Hymenobacter busanensis]KAA9331511.1 RecX family transcriptional regulator [Hymenobacter busanensis]QHJ08665.1 RecX family transcriptional regulator [Hymenobacter busanensis]